MLLPEQGRIHYLHEFKLQDGIYPLEIPVEEGHGKGGIETYIDRRPRNGELIAECHRSMDISLLITTTKLLNSAKTFRILIVEFSLITTELFV